jgi:hypothetical protein
MRIIRSRFTSAHLIALLALFVALGGSAYAFHLGKNAVKTKNIKNGAVVESKLAGGAVSADKLAGGAVGASSLGQVVIRTTSTPMPDNTTKVAIATCNPGERLISGSGIVGSSNSPDIVLNGEYPSDAGGGGVDPSQSPTSWTVYANNYSGGDTGVSNVTARALCLK